MGNMELLGCGGGTISIIIITVDDAQFYYIVNSILNWTRDGLGELNYNSIEETLHGQTGY